MQKRGVSPLIAVVLLVGFTVALAVLIFNWTSIFSSNLQRGVQEGAKEGIACSFTNLPIIRNACDDGTTLQLTVENPGEINMQQLKVRITGSNVNKNADVAGISPFGVAPFSVASAVGTVLSVEIFPTIQVEGKEVTCSTPAMKKNVGSCTVIVSCTEGTTQSIACTPIPICTSASQIQTCSGGTWVNTGPCVQQGGVSEICEDGVDNDCVGGDATCPLPNPVAYWSFNSDTAGSPGETIGLTQSPPNTAGIDSVKWKAGGGSLSLQGGYGTSSNKYDITSKWTLSVWVRKGEAINIIEHGILRNDNVWNNFNGWRLNFPSNPYPRMKVGFGTSYVFLDFPPIEESNFQWHHLVVTHDQGTFKLYMDGINTKTEIVSGTLSTGDQNLVFGVGGSNNPALGGFPLNGNIDELAIYDATLSDAQVLNLYNSFP